ncbi:MAG TPA: 4-alpha-glucanotransferase [Bryobacteraceae bacterium]|nr:4-alpha-glucanotransferase [Bryobacteraceae bacterium]
MLHDLCRRVGLQTEYWDIWGQRHTPSDEALRALLAALGIDAANPGAAAVPIPLDPVAVVLASEAAPSVALRIPAGYEDGLISTALYWEDGGAVRRDHRAAALESAPNGMTGFRLPLPAPLRLGYHDLEAVISAPAKADVRMAMRVIATPGRAWVPEQLDGSGKLAGLSLCLWGIRSERNWGAGDFTDLEELVQWAAARLGVSMIGLNPLHALHNREPYNVSPYLPLTVFYRNDLYLDPERMEEFAQSRWARRFVESERFQKRVADLRAAELVDYESVVRLKRLVFRVLFREFLREMNLNTAHAREFVRWRGAEGDLLTRYATYRALDEHLHKLNPELWIWPDWPGQYQDPESEAVAEFVRTHPRRILFHQWLQWHIDRQLASVQRTAQDAGMPIGLYHDLALATDRCGADLWGYRRFYAEGARVGSPPDDFAPEGQDWAFPPALPDAHRADCYRLFAESIRRNARPGGALRIDHVMRFFRLFWIPDGMPAKAGSYLHDHWRDLIRVLCLESHRGRFLVVGEDLGTCPDWIRTALHDHGILAYRLFYFERGQEGRPKAPNEYDVQALVSSTTHDLPTLAGYWGLRDLEVRRKAGLLPDETWYEGQTAQRHRDKAALLDALIAHGFLPTDFPREAANWTELTGELHNAIIGYLASTPSKLLLLNQEDLTKETEQQNLPGTTWQYPNWKRKMALTLAELEGPQAAGFAEMFHAWLERTGRLAGPGKSRPNELA